MEREEFKSLSLDYITGNLTGNQERKFEEHLNENPDLNAEVDEIKRIMDTIEESVPEKPEEMDHKFYKFLDQEIQKQKRKKFNLFSNQDYQKNFYNIAFGCFLIIIGFTGGKFLNKSTGGNQDQISVAEKEMEDVRAQLVLALLDEPSANQRLRAVNEANKLNSVSSRVVDALFLTLNNDNNINVRLSAIEALAPYADIPSVRERLISSIQFQDSPLIQMALADLMVTLQESRAVESFQKIIEQDSIHESVRLKIEQTIRHLI